MSSGRDEFTRIDLGDLVGTTMPRYVAASMDLLVACGMGIIAAQQFSESHLMVQLGIAVIVGWLYFFVMEALTQRTLGKMLMGVKVVSLSGHVCTVRQTLVRSLMRLVETNPMVLGGLPACLSAWVSPLKQRIGDRMAGTTVVLSSYPYRRREEAKEIDRRNPLA